MNILDIVSAANPVSVADLEDTAGTDEAAALLARITASPPVADSASTRRWGPPRRSGRRLVIVGAVAAAVSLTAIGLELGNRSSDAPAYAATPPMLHYRTSGVPADRLLDQLAARAERTPDRAGTGRYDYVKTRAWSMELTVDPHGRTMSAGVVPDVTQTWLGPDGTGRTVTKAGATEPKGTKKLGSHDGVAEAQGAPAAHVPPVRLAGLSTNPTVLARQLAALARAADNATKPSSQPTYNEIEAIWAQQPVPPKLQAAFLRVLATIPNLRDLGSTTDRVGRPGRAVGFDTTSDGAVTRQIIILDPSTGAPLGEEQILLSDPHHMSQWSVIPIHVPAVVDYTAYLASAHVPTVHSTS